MGEVMIRGQSGPYTYQDTKSDGTLSPDEALRAAAALGDVLQTLPDDTMIEVWEEGHLLAQYGTARAFRSSVLDLLAPAGAGMASTEPASGGAGASQAMVILQDGQMAQTAFESDGRPGLTPDELDSIAFQLPDYHPDNPGIIGIFADGQYIWAGSDDEADRDFIHGVNVALRGEDRLPEADPAPTTPTVATADQQEAPAVEFVGPPAPPPAAALAAAPASSYNGLKWAQLNTKITSILTLTANANSGKAEKPEVAIDPRLSGRLEGFKAALFGKCGFKGVDKERIEKVLAFMGKSAGATINTASFDDEAFRKQKHMDANGLPNLTLVNLARALNELFKEYLEAGPVRAAPSAPTDTTRDVPARRGNGGSGGRAAGEHTRIKL